MGRSYWVAAFCVATVLVRAADYGDALAQRVLPANTTHAAYDVAMAAIDAADRAADAAWGGFGSSDAYRTHATRLRAAFIDAIGGLDLPRTPLRAQVTGTVQREGYSIEKVLFESRPGVYVTGLLFLPDPTRFAAPYPAYIVPCGHDNDGKGAAAYQRGGVQGALAGFAAFVYDPFSQGEREQVPGGLCCAPHNRYGALAELLGQSTARQRIWDGIRALDYLDTRSDIRHDGYGCMGNSGGGTETALLETVEPRIVAACPSCFISTLRDVYAANGPQDAEQQVFGELAFGFNHAGHVLAGGNAVRIHCNFDDFFPYAGACSTIAVVTNAARMCGLDVTRYGMTDVAGPHGWYESARTSSVQWMRRWLGGDLSALPIDVSACRALDNGFSLSAVDCGLTGTARYVTPTGRVKDLAGFRSVFDLLKDDLAAAVAARPVRSTTALGRIAAARAGIRDLSEIGATVRLAGEQTLADGVRVRREIFSFADGFPVPLVTFFPAGTPTGLILVTDTRARTIHINRVAEALASGRAIALVDLAAGGETGTLKHAFYGNSNADEEVAVMLYTLGRSLVGVRAEETIAVAAHLVELTGLRPVVVAHNRSVIPVAHAALVRRDLFEGIEQVSAPNSWASSIQTSESIPMANVVHGALLDYDWTDLVVAFQTAPAGTVAVTNIEKGTDFASVAITVSVAMREWGQTPGGAQLTVALAPTVETNAVVTRTFELPQSEEAQSVTADFTGLEAGGRYRVTATLVRDDWRAESVREFIAARETTWFSEDAESVVENPQWQGGVYTPPLTKAVQCESVLAATFVAGYADVASIPAPEGRAAVATILADDGRAEFVVWKGDFWEATGVRVANETPGELRFFFDRKAQTLTYRIRTAAGEQVLGEGALADETARPVEAFVLMGDWGWTAFDGFAFDINRIRDAAGNEWLDLAAAFAAGAPGPLEPLWRTEGVLPTERLGVLTVRDPMGWLDFSPIGARVLACEMTNDVKTCWYGAVSAAEAATNRYVKSSCELGLVRLMTDATSIGLRDFVRADADVAFSVWIDGVPVGNPAIAGFVQTRPSLSTGTWQNAIPTTVDFRNGRVTVRADPAQTNAFYRIAIPSER